MADLSLLMEEKIRSDLKQAMLAHDEIRVSTLRLLLSEITNAAIAKGSNLSDEEITSVIQKELKKRREAFEAFKTGGKVEAAGREDQEAKVLEGYLPVQLSDEELTRVVEQVITELGAAGFSDMGRVIGGVREKVGIAADPSRISNFVRLKLNG